MKICCVFLLAFSLSHTSLPAQVNTDSLWRVWNNRQLADTLRLSAIQRLAFRYTSNHPDSARLLAQAQLAFARERRQPDWQARALNTIGLSYRFQSDYETALHYYRQSIALLEKTGNRRYLTAVYGNMGDLYRIQSNFPKAIECIMKSLQLAEATGDRKHVADAYASIATIYYDDPGNNAKTLEYLEKALAEYQTLNNQEGLSLVYGNMSAVYLDQDDFDKALLFNEKSLTIQEKRGDQHGMATSLLNRAIIHGNQGRFEQATLDFERGAAFFRSIGDLEGLADAYNGMGDLWIRQKRYAPAVTMCSKALEITRQTGSFNLREVDACNCLYTAYLELGNYKQALNFLEQFIATKDSLQQHKTAQQLRQMELERQTVADSLGREKEKFRVEMAHQQAMRRKDQTLGWLAAAGLGTLAIALGFWVRMLYFRRRAQLLQVRSNELEKQKLINEIALLRTQVNPHFLFNSLSILSSLVHVNADLSEQFIEQLSRSYRYILEQKEQSLVSLRTELEFIESYIFLLKIRFDNKLDLVVQLPDDILDDQKIAPLTLQLLLENAVKHNRMSEKEPLIVTVSVENGDTLVVKNRLQLRATAPVSTGIGLQNIADRYALLTDRPVWAGETQEAFVVKIPLLS